MRVQMSSQITKILEGKTDLIFIFYYLRALVKALPLSFTVKGQGERAFEVTVQVVSGQDFSPHTLNVTKNYKRFNC